MVLPGGSVSIPRLAYAPLSFLWPALAVGQRGAIARESCAARSLQLAQPWTSCQLCVAAARIVLLQRTYVPAAGSFTAVLQRGTPRCLACLSGGLIHGCFLSVEPPIRECVCGGFMHVCLLSVEPPVFECLRWVHSQLPAQRGTPRLSLSATAAFSICIYKACIVLRSEPGL